MSIEIVSHIIEALKVCIEKIEILNKYNKLLSDVNFPRDILVNINGTITEEEVSRFFDEFGIYDKELSRALEVANEVLKEFLEDKDSINIQYITFLQNELINFDWNQFAFLNNDYFEKVNLFNETFQKEVPMNQEDFSNVNICRHIIQNFNQYKQQLTNKVASTNIFNRIHSINNNIVIIGPNGSGKSRFSRNLNGKLGSNFSIISAQHLLVYQSPQQITVNGSVLKEVLSFQKGDKIGIDSNLIHIFNNDFSNLMLALFEEEQERAFHLYERREDRIPSILSKTIEIWEVLITHRKIIKQNKYDIKVKTNEGKIYNFNDLSDGEKAIFYYIGHILLAEENSYIIIDEPENHLHLSICIYLWNILEQKRKDCKFIYITHNLDFAVSRNDKTILWNKNFNPPFDWEVEEIKSEETIPEILLLEIMGSRRNIIFCEGDDRNSLDYKIYSRIFPNYNVIPVLGHDNVISYCKSFNRNKGLGRLKAFGIIDKDAWTITEIESMRRDNILVLPYNEIENLFCSKVILKLVIDLVGTSPNALDNFIEAFFKVANAEKENLSTWYANNRINNYLKHNLFQQSKDIQKLKKEVENNINSEKIQEFYDEMLNKVKNDLENKDFDELIKYVNLKKKLTRELANKYIVNDYEERIINLLSSKEDFQKELQREIVEKYFSVITENKSNIEDVNENLTS